VVQEVTIAQVLLTDRKMRVWLLPNKLKHLLKAKRCKVFLVVTIKTAGQVRLARSKAKSKLLKSKDQASNSTLSRLQQLIQLTEALMLLAEAGAE